MQWFEHAERVGEGSGAGLVDDPGANQLGDG